MKKFIFFIIILGIVFGLFGFWYWQKNPYSKDILRLEILGPEEAAVFDEIEYTIKYKNNGDVRLEQARLIFEFPENTLLEEGLSRRQEIGPDELGDIYPGEERTFNFKGRLFGGEGEVRTARAWLNYKVRDLNASYESNTEINTKIKSAPLSFDFDISSKIERGRDFKFSINYFSSLDYPMSGLSVKTEYPNGFDFIESSPESLSDNEWDIPLLNKAEGGRIEIKGRLSGEVKEQKLFKAILGIWHNDEFFPLKEITKGVEISRPQLFVSQRINGSDNYIASPGDSLHYEVFFRNVSDEPFRDLFLAVTFNSNLFDFSTIKAGLGSVRGGDNSIFWDQRNVSELSFLDQGKEGKVEFWIDVKDDQINDFYGKDVFLKNSILISHLEESFETKINSKLRIVQKGYFQDEIFGNSGAIPPRVGESTSYTITWQAKNYYNDVKNVKVKAKLPSNVEPTGRIFPEDEKEKFTFDRVSREIVWQIGDMEAGRGVINEAPNISFQVVLTPGAGQRGKNAPLIEEVRISGEDQWTERTAESFSPAIDTSLPDDESVSEGQGVIR